MMTYKHTGILPSYSPKKKSNLKKLQRLHKQLQQAETVEEIERIGKKIARIN